MIRIPFYTLQSEAEREIYDLIDKNLKPLPRKSDGTFDSGSEEFQDNDVDALRHAYTSGVFTMEHGERVADFLGRLQEWIFDFGEQRKNMDLWNNAVGRTYGKKSKTRKELFESLVKALRRGELIESLYDKRKHTPSADVMSKKMGGRVIVLKESETGENILFFDVKEKMIFSREVFVSEIKDGKYGKDYEIRIVNGKEIPVSKRDGKDNLG